MLFSYIAPARTKTLAECEIMCSRTPIRLFNLTGEQPLLLVRRLIGWMCSLKTQHQLAFLPPLAKGSKIGFVLGTFQEYFGIFSQVFAAQLFEESFPTMQ